VRRIRIDLPLATIEVEQQAHAGQLSSYRGRLVPTLGFQPTQKSHHVGPLEFQKGAIPSEFEQLSDICKDSLDAILRATRASEGPFELPNEIGPARSPVRCAD
jgi:hypothetical protein